jgi:uncharacterized membrane protein SpoIIM required for sporulation
MDYGRFQQLRRPLWDTLERRLRQLGAGAAMSYADLEDLAFTYRQVLHDHALASHRFPGTGAARRLAALALEATRRLTRQGGRPGGLWHFVSRTFPAAFRRQLGMLGMAAMVFGAGAAFGLTLSAVQPELGRALLGARAIEGLEEGRLWIADMTTVPPAVTSSRIATNNLSVALAAWAGGILAGAVPLFMLTLNGLLLGGAVGVTLRYSMAGDLLTFVAAHGPLEITLVLVAAAAGLSIGRALVTAGDRPRGEALRLAAADSLLVMGGCLPWFVVLAAVEGSISPNPAVPVTFKVALGVCLEVLFLAAALAPWNQAEAADGGSS